MRIKHLQLILLCPITQELSKRIKFKLIIFFFIHVLFLSEKYYFRNFQVRIEESIKLLFIVGIQFIHFVFLTISLYLFYAVCNRVELEPYFQ